jgi:protein phosphatase
MRPPEAGTGSPSRPRPAPRRRGRWLPRAIIAGVVIVALAIGAVYVVSRNVYFVGTNDDGLVTLYRGLPYDLPLGVKLYTSRYVSGVPALSVPAKRRDRVLDHQLRSRGDASDLIKSLDASESP